MPPAIELQGVRVSLGPREILRGVDLAVEAGELVAVVGASGSGKTTLLRCVNRLLEPMSGTVRLLGHDVHEGPAPLLRRSIGYVVQRGGLFPHWSAVRNAGAVLELQGVPIAERAARARAALIAAGLAPDEIGDRLPSELSGGQRQRVALARALAPRPKILLLDEPFGALDAITRRRVRRSMASELRAAGAAILLVTHDMREAFELANRIAVMEDGRLSQQGAPATLRAAPATPFVAELLEDLES
jgi:osmoprotectant transport system ATP-binding protein